MLANRWIILRTSGPRTLSVRDSLGDAGFEVWTPVGLPDRVRHRSKRLAEKKTPPKPVPVMPTYVFAQAVHLHDLLAEASRPVSQHPPFSVFRWDGRIPLIDDRSLEYLRRGEQRYMRRMREEQKVKPFAVGSEVTLTEGVGAGLSGIVEQSKGKFTLVCFPGYNTPLKIATMLLVGAERACEADMAA